MGDKGQRISSVILIKKRIGDFKDAVDVTICKLEDHKRNLEKMEKEKETFHLKRETLQAITTLKKIDLLLRDISDFKNSIETDSPEEADRLKNLCKSLEDRINQAKNSFSDHIDDKVVSNNLIAIDDQIRLQDSMQNSEPDERTLKKLVTLEEDIKAKRQMCESYLQLQKNLQDLNETILSFADLVQAQGETIDTIESNIENTIVSVNEGVADLSKASRLKKAMVPVTAAMMGSCVGGPVGAIFGLKVAIVGALTSAVLSYGSVKYIQKKKDTIDKKED